MAERAMRPFWIHQVAEYVIGIALISLGLQDPEPLVPVFAGALVVVNAALVDGPLGAFRSVRRGLHRWLDLGVMAVLAAAALQPWVTVGVTGRSTLLAVLVPLGFLWFYTDWAERSERRRRRVDRAGPRGEEIGRSAGRLAGQAYGAIRKRSGSQ